MSGAEAGGDIAIVFAALVGIADQEGDGCAGGFASNTPERISTWSASRRWVTWRLVPGLRRSRSNWISASLNSNPGGSRQ